jgi:hypothetical protein
VNQALRRAPIKNKRHTDHELFGKAYGGIRPYF